MSTLGICVMHPNGTTSHHPKCNLSCVNLNRPGEQSTLAPPNGRYWSLNLRWHTGDYIECATCGAAARTLAYLYHWPHCPDRLLDRIPPSAAQEFPNL
jgi:hypothetical protein